MHPFYKGIHMAKHNCCTFLGLILILSTNALAVASSFEPINVYDFKQLFHSNYSQPGDINIGAIIITWEDSETHPAEFCSRKLKWPVNTIQSIEAVSYTVDMINRNPTLLPNVTLGFDLLGSCLAPGPAIATSLSYLPHNQNISNDNCPPGTDHCLQNYDVIGIMSSGQSSLGMPLSSLYSVANIPVVGPSESSDVFSDKNKHPYFFRVLSPNVFFIRSIISFVVKQGWSYVSVIYIDDQYGQNAIKTTLRIADEFGVCVAASHALTYFSDYDSLASNLLANPRARVVIIFLWGSTFRSVLQAVSNKNATGHFIWLGYLKAYLSDSNDNPGLDGDPAIGTIDFDHYGPEVPEFNNYLRNQNPRTSSNPWFKPIWENLFNCSFDLNTCDPEKDLMQSSLYQYDMLATYRMDAVLTLAHAAHDLLSKECPNARGQAARNCITGKRLKEYMENVNFQGFVNQIKFDENQDVLGKYSINQYVYDRDVNGSKRLVSKLIGIYDASNEQITNVEGEQFIWSHLYVKDRIVPWEEGLPSIEIPESVCSGPCGVGEYRIEKEVTCCWDCIRCRENERLVQGNTSCETCPEFMWPDPSSAFTTCVDIPLTYPKLDETIPIVLLSLGLFALIVDIIITISYIIYRDERVIKASSRELSVIQLVAIFGGYVNVILFQIEPTNITCTVIFFLFCMTFILLYAPLLVKTIRIFRIFQSGKTNKQNLRFISPGSQLIITVCVIAVQAILSIATYILFSPGAHRTQPIWSEKYVELSCDLTLPGLTSFLGYNIVLVSLCSVFAFKTRKLPDNFNESQFISMCVATTLLIWLAFIPTYFTADREFVRVFLLSVALLLNHSVALIFLFMPKIYAATFLPPENTNVSGKKI